MEGRYMDGRGLAFAEHRERLPRRAVDFPKRHIVQGRPILADWRTENDAPDVGLLHVVGAEAGRVASGEAVA